MSVTVKPEDYYQQSDGADWALAIQRGIDDGQGAMRLELSASYYRVDRTIDTRGRPFTVVGASPAVELDARQSVDSTVLRTSGDVRSSSIECLLIRGRSDQTGIELGSEATALRSVGLVGLGAGVRTAREVHGLEIDRGCEFLSCQRGVHVAHLVNAALISARFFTVGRAVIWETQGHLLTLDGARMEYCTGPEIEYWGEQLSVERCWIGSSQHSGPQIILSNGGQAARSSGNIRIKGNGGGRLRVACEYARWIDIDGDVALDAAKALDVRATPQVYLSGGISSTEPLHHADEALLSTSAEITREFPKGAVGAAYRLKVLDKFEAASGRVYVVHMRLRATTDIEMMLRPMLYGGGFSDHSAPVIIGSVRRDYYMLWQSDFEGTAQVQPTLILGGQALGDDVAVTLDRCDVYEADI